MSEQVFERHDPAAQAPAGAVAVVTDSTASLPAELIAQFGITVVPVCVIIGDTSYDEGEGITPATVAEQLVAGAKVSTSRPSPDAMSRAYRGASSRGARRIVSAHISSQLSATHESALLAATHAPVPTTVIDSHTTGMALGFAAVAGARAATAGADADTVAAVIRDVAGRSVHAVYVESLEFLKRGGRVSARSAAIGAALRMHPLLAVSPTGTLEVLSKVRTQSRAIGALVDHIVSVSQSYPEGADVAVHHCAAQDLAQRVADMLRLRLGERATSVALVPLSAALSVHVGPGAVSVAAAPAVRS